MRARPGQILTATAAIAATPVCALLLLAATGLAAFGPALTAATLTILAAIAIALLWTRDLDLLTETVRLAAAGEPHPPAVTHPTLASVEHLTREIERLSRAMAARAALVEQISRADEAIVERLPDPLIVLDAARTVRRTNAAARAAYGQELAAVLRHPGLRAALDRALARADTSLPETAELTVPAPVHRDVRATVIVLDPPLADGGQALLVLSDRTRERAVERTRADFVANASHELRTPLSSLIGFIETIRGPASDDPPAQQRFLGIMAAQAERMSRLIDDLLSLSRVELTEHQAPADSVDIGVLLARLAEGFEPKLAQRSVTLTMAIPPALPLVTGDVNQLAQVAQNLIDNAIKYGREGGTVRVSAQAVAPDSGSRWPGRPGVVMTVADDGAGVARQHLPRLTERFYRVDKGRSSAAGGTGLGLAIVKHIVNRHRGVLQIDSEEGVGTTISIWLPRSLSQTPTASLPEPAPADPPRRRPGRTGKPPATTPA